MSPVRIRSPAPFPELPQDSPRIPILEVLHDWVPFVVHSVRDVLAAGADRAVPVSDRMAIAAAIPAGGDRGGRRAGHGGGDHHAAFPGTASRLSRRETCWRYQVSRPAALTFPSQFTDNISS